MELSHDFAALAATTAGCQFWLDCVHFRVSAPHLLDELMELMKPPATTAVTPHWKLVAHSARIARLVMAAPAAV